MKGAGLESLLLLGGGLEGAFGWYAGMGCVVGDAVAPGSGAIGVRDRSHDDRMLGCWASVLEVNVGPGDG